MPPCAATVCERVGNTLESTATLSPARASWSDARMPEPPAPTMTTSNLRRVTPASLLVEPEVVPGSISKPPKDLDCPAGAAEQPDHGEDHRQQPRADVLDV